MPVKDITGVRCGLLVAKRFVRSDGPPYYRAIWWCQCDCGNALEVAAWAIRERNKISCGCRRGATTHGLSKLPEHGIWHSMIQRCHNASAHGHRDYGGRGITVCERWRESFEAFFADMGKRPSPKHSIDRIDNDGNYEPGNVRWATQAEQRRNSRQNTYLTLSGVTLCAADWADRAGIKRTTLHERLKRGWTVERALTTP